MRRIRFLLPVVALAAAACSTEPPSGPGGAPAELTQLPRELSAAERKVLGASNAFTFALFRQVASAQSGENVFVSPLSASMALGMTLNGAAGTTFDEMRAALQSEGLSQEEINQGYRSLIDLLRSLDPATDMRVANSIWWRQGLGVEPGFVDATKRWFDARAEALDFDSPTAPKTINDWVSASTNGTIPTIVEQIDRDIVMYLINAIYFKGSWRERFDASRTIDAPFHAADGSTRPAKLMHRTGSMLYAATPRYQAVELPYGNAAFAMTILLPSEGTTAEALAASLTQDEWSTLTGRLAKADVDLHLPRFTLAWKRTLNDDLMALGMHDAFDPSHADFSRIVTGAGLFVSKVDQKTFVKVDEEGTEAAAVTSVSIGVTSLPAQPVVRVDRPFVFALRERLTGTVLFAGKIVALP